MKKLIRTRAQAPRPTESEVKPLPPVRLNFEISPDLIRAVAFQAPLAIANIAPLSMNFISLKFELRRPGLTRALDHARIAYSMLSRSEQEKPLNRFWVQAEEGEPLSLQEFGVRDVCEKLITSKLTVEMLSSLPDELLILVEKKLDEFASEAIKAWPSGPTVSSLNLARNSNIYNLALFTVEEQRAFAPTPSIIQNSLYLSLP